VNSEITAFARGAKCGGFTANGFDPSGFAEQARTGLQPAALLFQEA
jgi:hypothetical protein